MRIFDASGNPVEVRIILAAPEAGACVLSFNGSEIALTANEVLDFPSVSREVEARIGICLAPLSDEEWETTWENINREWSSHE